MKLSAPLLICILILASLQFTGCRKNQDPVVQPVPTSSDSFSVSVANGYGSGKYKVGDTVHVFTNHYTDGQLFDKWGGDISLLNAPNEWHTWFVMPARAVTLTGSLKTVSPLALQLVQIRGRDRLKPVYYFFPSNHKGFVYLLHGTGGKASSVVSSYEFQILMKDLIADNFGVVVTEAEEATTGIDANADGKLRWAATPVDTINNVDFANIRIITDSLYRRGLTNRSKLRFSVGMSNGGAYSVNLSSVYQYKAGVSYCAQGNSSILQITQTPLQYTMARFDNNDEVGPTGNTTAQNNSNILNNRGVCSKFLVKERAPIYAERFARRGDITISQSMTIFNELKSKGYIGSRNYYIGYSDVLNMAYLANPASFPVLNSLTPAQRSFVQEQIDLSVSDHQMYSDFNRATVKFLNSQCL